MNRYSELDDILHARVPGPPLFPVVIQLFVRLVVQQISNKSKQVQFGTKTEHIIISTTGRASKWLGLVAKKPINVSLYLKPDKTHS